MGLIAEAIRWSILKDPDDFALLQSIDMFREGWPLNRLGGGEKLQETARGPIRFKLAHGVSNEPAAMMCLEKHGVHVVEFF
jgi:hypothetical protein